MNAKEIAFIRSVFGKHYTTPVLKHLAKKKVVNELNEPYSASFIRGVVNGFSKNETVELEILKFTAAEAKKQAKIAKERAAITKHIKL